MTQIIDLWRDMERPFTGMSSGLQPLVRQLDDFFRTSLSPRDSEQRMMMPSCDIDETADHYLLSFDMPGLEKDQIDIEMHGNRLMVSGERKQEMARGEGVQRFVERRYGRFERTVTLPDDIKPDQVEAQYVNGVLKVSVPKEVQSRRQKISIGDESTQKGMGNNKENPKLAQ